MQKIFLAISLIITSAIHAQQKLPLAEIRRYTAQQPANKYDSSLKFLTNRLGAGIHYLYPLYQAATWESKFRKNMGEKVYHQTLANLLAAAVDQPSAIAEQVKSYDTLTQADRMAIADSLKKSGALQFITASAAVTDLSAFQQVVMINESPSNPAHRAFVYGLLEGFYKNGYRYFAMEALNNFANQSPGSLNVFTGYNIYEPVAGELLRKAIALGFTIVPYEDTLAGIHTSSQRDSTQASHLATIFKADKNAKMLVLASNRHNSKKEFAKGYVPMAAWFKKISGIDPYSINQTLMSEGSDFTFGYEFYNQLTDKLPLQEPVILYKNKRPYNPLQEKGYDLIITHPVTHLQHNRPSWLSFGGVRKPTLIQPTEKLLFYVQAYYANEYDADNLEKLIPADQTYTANREGYYALFLARGAYKIVLRDISYKILSVKDLEVN